MIRIVRICRTLESISDGGSGNATLNAVSCNRQNGLRASAESVWRGSWHSQGIRSVEIVFKVTFVWGDFSCHGRFQAAEIPEGISANCRPVCY
jgi:hypothetical protein